MIYIHAKKTQIMPFHCQGVESLSKLTCENACVCGLSVRVLALYVYLWSVRGQGLRRWSIQTRSVGITHLSYTWVTREEVWTHSTGSGYIPTSTDSRLKDYNFYRTVLITTLLWVYFEKEICWVDKDDNSFWDLFDEGIEMLVHIAQSGNSFC